MASALPKNIFAFVLLSVIPLAAHPARAGLNVPILDQTYLTYLGSFQYPTQANGWSTAFSYGGFTHRYLNGKLQFFGVSHVYSGGLVYEVNYPGLSLGPPYPQATVVTNWGDVYTGHKCEFDSNGNPSCGLSSGLITNGLFYDDINARLYWSYGDSYNTVNTNNPTLGYSVLNDDTGVATGVGAWNFTNRPEKFARGGACRIPQWFANQFTGGKTLGVGFGGYYSIIGSGSLGPALLAANDPNINTNPDLSSLNNVPMVGYPTSQPIRGERNDDYYTVNGEWGGVALHPQNGIGSWTWDDTILGAGQWIDTPNVQGFLVIGNLGEGLVQYIGSTITEERGDYEWQVYDPNDLAAVANGADQQYQIQPKNRWIAREIPYSGQDSIGGVTFDSTTNRLYVLIDSAWKSGVEYYPQVYVYQLSQTPPAPTIPSILTPPSSLTVNAGSVATFIATCTGSPLLTFQWQRNNGGSWTDIVGSTRPVYNFPVVNSDTGAQFRLVVTNGQGSVTSSAATLTVIPGPTGPPSITTQPADQTVLPGQTASFFVVATGTPAVNYDWWQSTDGGFTWTRPNQSGQPTWTVGPVAIGDNGTEYEAEVFNVFGDIFSTPATLFVSTPTVPIITIQPSNETVNSGSAAIFVVAAVGQSPLSYQWATSTDGGTTWTNIPGASSAQYTTGPLSVGNNNAEFEVAITNILGNATSSPATVTVLAGSGGGGGGNGGGASSDGGPVTAFPNPFRIGKGSIHFNTPAGSTIQIYSKQGLQVRSLSSFDWDGMDGNGHDVAAGLYLAIVDLPNGSQVHVKIVAEK